MNRDQLIEHFENKYKDNSFVSPDFKSIDTTLLRKQYERDCFESKELERIKTEGLEICRLEFKNENELKEVIKFMEDNQLYCWYDNQIKFRIERGSNFIYGIPISTIEILKKQFSKIEFLTYEKSRVLGKKQIKKFKKDDKVVLTVGQGFLKTQEKGTVVKVQDNELVIRKYRARTRGFILKVGTKADIKKVESFKNS